MSTVYIINFAVRYFRLTTFISSLLEHKFCKMPSSRKISMIMMKVIMGHSCMPTFFFLLFVCVDSINNNHSQYLGSVRVRLGQMVFRHRLQCYRKSAAKFITSNMNSLASKLHRTNLVVANRFCFTINYQLIHRYTVSVFLHPVFRCQKKLDCLHMKRDYKFHKILYDDSF